MITIAPISKTKPSFSGLFGFLVINAVCCAWVVFRYKSKYKKVGVLPIRIVKSNVSSVHQPFYISIFICMLVFLSVFSFVWDPCAFLLYLSFTAHNVIRRSFCNAPIVNLIKYTRNLYCGIEVFAYVMRIVSGVCCAYSSRIAMRILRIRYASSLRMNDMRILRVCYAYPRVCYACSSRMLRLSYVSASDGGL